MVKELINFQMETLIRVLIKTEGLMDMDNTIGRMVVFTKESSRMG
jgi:hypothetical protein